MISTGMVPAGVWIAMGIGIVGTCTIHLSKGIMKLGVQGLKASGLKVQSPSARMGLPARRFYGLLYAAGIGLNFTNPLWVIVANRFAPTVYYTSMYGLGLIALLAFARFALAERIDARQIAGTLIIVMGTTVIGSASLTHGTPSLIGASRTLLVIVAAAWLVGAPLAAILVARRSVGVQELVFGIAGGGLAALDALAKGVAQAGAVANTFLPQNSANWLLFAASFAGAAGAFGMIQWSYLRHCRAALMGAAYTVAYVTLPIILSPLLIGTSEFVVTRLLGTFMLAAGAVLIVLPHSPTPGTAIR